MRRAVFFTISILLIISNSIETRGQVFQGFTYEELARPLQQMARAHNEMMSAINSLSNYVVDVLGHDIDAQLRKEMNSELKNLDNLGKQLANYGYSVAIVNNYNGIYRSIQQEIANYNNRVARAREKAAKEDAERRERAARMAAEPENWSGSGFALKDGYIATNYHVVERAKSIMVHGINGNMSTGYVASIVGVDRVNDLAIIRITDSHFSGFGPIPYRIRNDVGEVGEDIWVLGYPLTQVLGNEIKLTNGVISSQSGYQGDVATYQISAPVQPGNSGGPLFDSKGDIVGIVNSGIPGADNVGYAIKAHYLRNLAGNYALTPHLPTNNTISSMTLKDQVKNVRNFVFLLVCSSGSNSFTTSSSSIITSSNSSSGISSSSKSSQSNSIVSQSSTLASSGESVKMVDLGLSVKWADRNMGADSPEGYGSYLAWGETSPKSSYSWRNYRFTIDRVNGDYADYVQLSKYTSNDGKTQLDPVDDVARAYWGGSWRIPTSEEFDELITHCTWTWVSQGGHYGYKVVSKINGNSIFLPAAGIKSMSDFSGLDSSGCYYSASLNIQKDNGSEVSVLFINSDRARMEFSARHRGRSIRPVSK